MKSTFIIIWIVSFSIIVQCEDIPDSRVSERVIYKGDFICCGGGFKKMDDSRLSPINIKNFDTSWLVVDDTVTIKYFYSNEGFVCPALCPMIESREITLLKLN
jgi:hypothetical protein